MSPNAPPRLFLDRNLGSRFVPGGLREHGWLVTTMDEQYGKDESQNVADVDWIRDAAALGECLLTTDSGIAHRPAEAAVVWMAQARGFVPGRGAATGLAQLELMLANEASVMRWASRAVAVHREHHR
ncbi:MAG: hypothetical protein LBL01_07435 [Bifidobacteriaceae bacterium]|jgi:hypothetical protein|nr:hypothetical protein [Bifidobacteriaceae bacterium]